MSTFTSAKPTIPQRGKPWKATPLQRLITVGIFAASVILSYVIVGVTPLKGKLGYAAVFFI